MKRVLLAAGMALALGATPIAAQTRVSVAVGFVIPRPYVTGVVIVGRRTPTTHTGGLSITGPRCSWCAARTWFGIVIISIAATTATTATLIEVARGPYHRSAACNCRFRMRPLSP